jgi:hypothetical protein
MSKKRKSESEMEVAVKKPRTKTTRKIPIEPKMPKKMDEVYSQIDAHPRYKELGEGTIFAYELGCKGGFSHKRTANNKWARLIWTKLYIDWNTDLDVSIGYRKKSVKGQIYGKDEEAKFRQQHE